MAELPLRVSPRSSRNELRLAVDGTLAARITAPPVDGEANQATIELISKSLGVPKSAVTIVSGASSRNKRVRIDGLTIGEVHAALGGLPDMYAEE